MCWPWGNLTSAGEAQVNKVGAEGRLCRCSRERRVALEVAKGWGRPTKAEFLGLWFGVRLGALVWESDL